MTPRRSLLAILFISVLGFLAFAPKDDDPLDRLVASLRQWTDTHPQEKVYLHMDKPYYALGDTIWFKAYVTTGSRHQLSAISGALHVDLITEKDSIVRSLKLPLSAGMSMGDFVLEDELKDGNYRIRAYTQWMRNAGEDYFFDHTFTVGSPVRDEIIGRSDYRYQTVDNKSVLTATLQYTDEAGKPLSGKNVAYDIMIDQQRAYSKSAKTDQQGNITVKISNENQADLRGAYIRTRIVSETAKGKKEVTEDFPIKAGLAQSDVQFFPESGQLINGVLSRVAFKATGIEGTGVAITGKILDNESREVADMESLKFGMGSFSMIPEPGKTYTAKIRFADSTEKLMPLPVALDEGYVLSVYQPNKDSILVRVSTSAKTLAAAQNSVNLSIIAQSGGATINALPVKLNRQISSFWLEKSAFPTGIAQFTLFNAAGEPLNERIAFVRSKDQMQLSLSTTKETYKSKERVELELDAKDKDNKPTAGNFSVTVIDESKVPFEEERESTIFSNLLLTSDLKGYIERPNYYFTKDDEEVNKALDNLMLTQGYRRFSWKEVAGSTANIPMVSNTTIDPNKAYLTNAMFKPEGLGTDITGVVKTLGGNLVPGAKLTLMATKAGILESATADANGRFKFEGLVLTDSIKFAVQALSPKKGTKVEIVLDTVPTIYLSKNRNIADVNTNIAGTIKAYIDNSRKRDSIYEKIGQLNRVQKLREVNISARKVPAEVYAPHGQLQIPEGHSDLTYILKNPTACANLGTCLQGQLGGGMVFREYMCCATCRIQNYPYYRGKVVQTVLDGRMITDCDELAGIYDLNSPGPEDIVKIEVATNNLALMATVSPDGVPVPTLFIYTNRGLPRKVNIPNIANISPKGFNKAREFYSPRYDRPSSNIDLPDLRSTIYWNANVKTYSTGKTTLNYFNADGPGNYKVIVEGINAEGELGRSVYHYAVEGELVTSQVNIPEESNKQIAAALDSLRKKMPVEKVYLHTDKPYYNIGDTLWFKSYVLDGANLTGSKQSGLLYVELDDDSAEVVRRISIPINNGLGWGQIPLTPKIFHEGGFTLRAYTNWMQNFGEDYVFSKRFYLGVPNQDTWLVKSKAEINRAEDNDQLNVDLQLSKIDKAPVGLRDVEIKIFEGAKWLYNEKMQTSQEGSLKFSKALKENTDGRNLRVEIRSLQETDGKQVLQVPLTINRAQKIDLQFLPESGYLVAGLKSVVGVKALAENGKGTTISGGIYDSKGNQITKFETLHGGMGSFEFTPKSAEVYTAKLDQPVGSEVIYTLPGVNAVGTVMRVQSNEERKSMTVQILGSANALNQDSTYYLIGTTRGVLYFSEKLDPNQPQMEIPESNFPTGIARFTSLKGKRPLNERIVFINHHDALNIKITQSKPSYLKRDSVALEIDVRDKTGMPVKGNFSLAVNDDSQVKPDSAGNFGITALLLTCDLKGKVESPAYYFSHEDEASKQALNNLMLTQGWTGYSWEDVFSNADPAKFSAEKEFKITGMVTNVFNKPVKGAPVLISSQKPSFIKSINTDETGRFTFRNLPQIDSGSFFLQARTRKGKTKSFGDIQVDRFKAPSVPPTFRDKVLPWYVNSDTSQVNYVKSKALKADERNLKQTGIGLKEVNIFTKKIIRGSQNRNGPGNADLVFDERDIKESGVMNLYQLIKQKLPGLTITFEDALPTLKLNNYMVTIEIDGGGLPLFLDGSPRIEDLKEALSEFQIAQFEGMEVMYSRKYTSRYVAGPTSHYFKGIDMAESENKLRTGKASGSGPFYYVGFKGGGYLDARVNVLTNKTREIAVIGITTRNKRGYFRTLEPDVVTYRPLPILYPVQFYSPKYLGDPADVAEPDYRSTIYWEPNIITDANGKARLSFYTSDIKGSYTISLEGQSSDGGLGSLRQKIKVN